MTDENEVQNDGKLDFRELDAASRRGKYKLEESSPESEEEEASRIRITEKRATDDQQTKHWKDIHLLIKEIIVFYLVIGFCFVVAVISLWTICSSAVASSDKELAIKAITAMAGVLFGYVFGKKTE